MGCEVFFFLHVFNICVSKISPKSSFKLFSNFLTIFLLDIAKTPDHSAFVYISNIHDNNCSYVGLLTTTITFACTFKTTQD